MIIALDYDDTWTRDNVGWFIATAALKERGHTIYGVTMRHERESAGMDPAYAKICEKVIFTGRKAKRSFVERVHAISVDVWIDDNPIWIETDAAS